MDTILLFSGGLDSTVLLYHLLEKGDKVACLSADYGQTHCKELQAAGAMCRALGVVHRTVHVPYAATIGVPHPLVGGGNIPQGRWDDPSMSATVVPNRNMIFLSLAGAWAMASGAGRVAIAAHLGDKLIYPDCRLEFLTAVQNALSLSSGRLLEVYAPFLGLPKDKVVAEGARMGVPFEKTWTCYAGGESPCGTCGACTERNDAFSSLGVEDPLSAG